MTKLWFAIGASGPKMDEALAKNGYMLTDNLDSAGGVILMAYWENDPVHRANARTALLQGKEVKVACTLTHPKTGDLHGVMIANGDQDHIAKHAAMETH